jgi:hypothetical protein
VRSFQSQPLHRCSSGSIASTIIVLHSNLRPSHCIPLLIQPSRLHWFDQLQTMMMNLAHPSSHLGCLLLIKDYLLIDLVLDQGGPRVGAAEAYLLGKAEVDHTLTRFGSNLK